MVGVKQMTAATASLRQIDAPLIVLEYGVGQLLWMSVAFVGVTVCVAILFVCQSSCLAINPRVTTMLCDLR
jgi:glycerol uptake facilitator-like aquaporin